MESFNQLLNQYIQRAGISDAELARTIGVSRQTIFRWREGVTSRPRHRDDVLVIAKKLRLTVEERDKLLLAAGFRPEQPESVMAEAEEASADQTIVQVEAEKTPSEPVLESAKAFAERQQQAEQPQPVSVTKPAPFIRPLMVGGFIILAVVAVFVGQAYWFRSVPPPPTPSPTMPLNPEEVVILITHFANYASDPVGFNVAGRLAEALQGELDDIALDNIEVKISDEPVDDRDIALQLGQQMEATLVIYGQYDTGRVMVEFAHPPDQTLFADPPLRQHMVSLDDLTEAINTDLPQQVRSLALIALGQIQVSEGNPALARPLLSQARDNLQDDPAVSATTWALTNFYLGVAQQHSQPPHLDQAIRAYGEAVEHWPEMLSSRLNRSAAYEARNKSGDLKSALTDADLVIEAAPEWGLAYNNRASILLTMGGEENLGLALADLEQTLALEPELPEAFLNRAYVHFAQGQAIEDVLPDIDQALDLRSDYGNAFNLLCWGYSLEGQAEKALEFCQKAVELEPENYLFQDSRGITQALLGDYSAAITDFTTYATWLESAQPGQKWEGDLMRRQAWIEALAEGENPFTSEVLRILRVEFGQ